MRRFLANSSMAFVVIAVALVWEIHRGTQNGTMTGVRQGLYVAGAVLAAALGVAGMKERHRGKN
jgi:hypothetical protein